MSSVDEALNVPERSVIEEAALERYRAFGRRQSHIPSEWGTYLAGFQAGSVFGTYVNSKLATLADPDFRWAIYVLAEILGLERGATV